MSIEGLKIAVYDFYCSDRQAVYKCGDKVRAEIGDVTILVNNAARVTGRRLLDCPDSTIENTFNVNLLGHFWVSIHREKLKYIFLHTCFVLILIHTSLINAPSYTAGKKKNYIYSKLRL